MSKISKSPSKSERSSQKVSKSERSSQKVSKSERSSQRVLSRGSHKDESVQSRNVVEETTNECESDADNFISTVISNNKIVMFTKSWCPYAMKLKQLFDEKGVIYTEVELDKLGDFGKFIQQRLGVLYGQSSVPNVFINGNQIGGYSYFLQMDNCCILDDILEGNSVAYDYNVIIIGGGSGGIGTAKELSKLGISVALCDYVKPSPMGTKWGLGGTCINVGCIPKKLMFRAAHVKDDVEEASVFGWPLQIEEAKIEWNQLVNGIQNHIKALNWANRRDLVSAGVTYINSFASIKTKHSVLLSSENEERTITCQKIIIAVGGRPRYLDIPGALENCITSDDFFTMEVLPKKVLIIGGSYVALELSSFMVKFGCIVHVMVRSNLLRGIEFDREVVDKLKEEMERDGVIFIMGFTPVSVTEDREKFKVHSISEDDTPFIDYYDKVVLAVGRDPNTKDIGLNRVGIKLCRNGKIPTNEKDQTVVRNIFAIGDCASNRPELTPVAVSAGKLLARRLCKINCHLVMDYRNIPRTVFTRPEYSCVGESEVSAKEIYGTDKVIVYESLYKPVDCALSRPTFKSFMKMLCVPNENNQERIVGLHVLCPGSGEIIQGFALAIKMKATKDDLDTLIGIHPTCAQMITMLVNRDSNDEEGELEMNC